MKTAMVLMSLALMAVSPLTAQSTAIGPELDWALPTFSDDVIGQASDVYRNTESKFACLFGEYRYIPSTEAIPAALHGRKYLYLDLLVDGASTYADGELCAGANVLLIYWRDAHVDSMIHIGQKALLLANPNLSSVVTIIGTRNRMVKRDSIYQMFEVPMILYDTRLSQWGKCYYYNKECNEDATSDTIGAVYRSAGFMQRS